MKANLDKVNFIEGANPKFVYAVAKNKDKCEQTIKAMTKMIEPSEGFKNYKEEADKLNEKYAEKDMDGTVGYVNHPVYGRAYRKIVGEGNPNSDHGKDMITLEEKYKKEIKEQKEKIKIYENHLAEEVTGDDYRWRMIDEEIIPAGLHPQGMSGCLEFINNKEEEIISNTNKNRNYDKKKINA